MLFSKKRSGPWWCCLAVVAALWLPLALSATPTSQSTEPIAATEYKVSATEARQFAAGELWPLRAVDAGTLPNSNQQLEAKQVELAQSEKLVLSSAAQKSDPPLSSRTPITSVDTAITADIQQLANSLNRDPLAIYRHFMQQYTFEPFYKGSLKGAQETLLQQAGNDVDLSSTLIATLRAAGLQARYVSGRVRFPAPQLPDWIGTLDVLNAANLLATARYQPTLYKDASGNLTQLELNWTWVEFYNQATSTWQALDVSFKPHSRASGPNLTQDAGLNPAELMQEMERAGQFAERDAISEPNLDQIDTITQQHQERLQEYARQRPDLTPAQLVAQRTVISQPVNTLPTSLPFAIQGTPRRLDILTDADRQHVEVAIPGFSHKLSMPAVAATRLTVDYVAATPTDQSKIDAAGGLLNVQYKAVNLKPQLRLGGVVVATGSAVSVGSYQTLSVAFWQGTSRTDVVNHNVTAGGIYAVALDTQKVSATKLQRSLTALNQLKDQHQQNLLNEAFAGEYLHFLGMSYFRQLDNVIDNVATGSSSIIFHQVSEALISIDLTARPNGSGQFLMSVGQRGIDAPRNIYSLFSNNNNAAFNRAATLLAVGYGASALEHSVFEKTAGWPSVSTISYLRFAANHEVPIYSINSSNINTQLPKLDLPAELKTSIQQAVAAGRVVITPKQQLKVGKWLGLGYIVLDPNTGAAGFLINGGQAGGRQNFTPMDQAAVNRTFLEDVGYAIRAAFNGALKGEFDRTVYNTPLESHLSQGVAFATDLLLIGDLRNVAISGWDYAFNGGGGGAVLLAVAGIIPVFDVAKKGHNLSATYFGNIGQANGYRLYENLSTDSSKVLANLSKNADISSVTSTRLVNSFDAVSTSAKRGNLQFTNIAVKDGHGYAASLGIDTRRPLDTATKSLLGERATVDYATKQLGLTCVLCNGKPSTNGFDTVFKDRQGNFVIIESKFTSSSANFGLGTLHKTKDDFRQMSDDWMFGAARDGGPDSALARTPGLTQQQQTEIRDAYRAGKVKRQFVVVTDQHRGLGVSDKFAKDPEFGGGNSQAKLDGVTFIELPIKP